MPTKIAVKAFGKRKFHKIISQEVLISFPIIELKISVVGMETEPKLRLSKNVPIKAKLKKTKSILCF